MTARVDTLVEVLDRVRVITTDTVLAYSSQRFVRVVRLDGGVERQRISTIIHERPLVRVAGRWRMTGVVREIAPCAWWAGQPPACPRQELLRRPHLAGSGVPGALGGPPMAKGTEAKVRELPLRITVVGPPPGVAWAIQGGRGDLVEPSERADALVAFDVSVRVGAPRSGGQPTLLGRVTQGPPDGRFVYVNSGQRAGQADSCWDRRAKVSLTGITRQLIESVEQNPGARLEALIAGTAADGGPACATVPLLEGGWRVLAPADA
ncbi:MAG: DUF5990 family protein [Gemmatimonadales bacterium]